MGVKERALAAGAAVLASAALLTGAVSASADGAALNQAADGQAAVSLETPDDGYNRSEFQVWREVGGCDTRDAILERDLVAEIRNPDKPCDIEGGTLPLDPYTGAAESGRGSTWDIDHRFTLHASWPITRTWTRQERGDFANNPANLVAVDARLNRSKGDQLPGDWLPPHDPCGYAVAVRAIAEHPVPGRPDLTLIMLWRPADERALGEACGARN